MQITIHDVIPKATLNLPMKRGTMAHRQTKREEAAPNGKKLQDKELHNLWSSQQICVHYYQIKLDDNWVMLTLVTY